MRREQTVSRWQWGSEEPALVLRPFFLRGLQMLIATEKKFHFTKFRKISGKVLSFNMIFLLLCIKPGFLYPLLSFGHLR